MVGEIPVIGKCHFWKIFWKVSQMTLTCSRSEVRLKYCKFDPYHKAKIWFIPFLQSFLYGITDAFAFSIWYKGKFKQFWRKKFYNQ